MNEAVGISPKLTPVTLMKFEPKTNTSVPVFPLVGVNKVALDGKETDIDKPLLFVGKTGVYLCCKEDKKVMVSMYVF